MNTSVFKNAAKDIPASVVVFLVALPLCLGIALGSNAPLFSGIIAGIIGGIVVGILSGSQLSVSGPAAGLTVIVAGAIGKLPAYEAFLLAVVIAGILQIVFGQLRAGVIGDFIPSSVIKGMLAAIGLILILKQFPHLVGWDADFEGDETFYQPDGENTFTELLSAFQHLTPIAVIIGSLSIAIQIVWDFPLIKSNRFLSLVPSALIVVVFGTGVNEWAKIYRPELALEASHLVTIPVSSSFTEFTSFFTFPDIAFLANPQVWITGVTLAIVASLESLLSIEASDKLDPYKRITNGNRELKAQGVGNIASGLLGGLPVTAVIVRSSANINAGAQSKLSAIAHGVLLLVCVYFIPDWLNHIPLSALAAVLIFVGYKLTKPQLFKEHLKKGIDQFVPFVVTIAAILFTDLLVGIMIGVVAGLFFIVKSNFKTSILFVSDGNNFLIRFRKEVSFLNKPILKEKFDSIPANSYVLIDATRSDFIDHDIVEIVNDFIVNASLRNIQVEIKKDQREGHNVFTPATKM